MNKKLSSIGILSLLGLFLIFYIVANFLLEKRDVKDKKEIDANKDVIKEQVNNDKQIAIINRLYSDVRILYDVVNNKFKVSQDDVIVIGDIAFDIHTSYGVLIGGNILAILIGLVLEFFLFSVDYSRTEHIQYEDDEYYYYVKAVPKMSVAAPEKMVKRINERRNPDEKESEEIRRRAPKRTDERKNMKKRQTEKETKKNSGTPRNTRVPANTDELLLAKSLQDELDIQDIVKRELEEH